MQGAGNGAAPPAPGCLSDGKEPRPRQKKGDVSPLGKGRKKHRPPDVRTIFTEDGEPRAGGKGRGHRFKQALAANAWCDLCCHFIWDQTLQCTDCKYTCHTHCRDLVQLVCQKSVTSIDHSSSSTNEVQQPLGNIEDVEKQQEPQKILTKDELRQKIEDYNSSVTDRLKMNLSPNEVYTGFIKVQMDLRRPITIRATSIPGRRAYNTSNETAFYLPKDTVNTLHISSCHTVKDVIEALLKKFTVLDNPAKFALFKQMHVTEQVHMSKLSDGQHPLYLRLLAGPSPDALSFVLRECETGEVLWEAFSLPELQNFLRILAKEEEDQFELLRRRYKTYRIKLEAALKAAVKPD
ncbi:ras association domain-containing protein 3-like [Narcine bancroftii]|uniref:ras association domain-containing protein 3-like n=1 Tax=Narcine bancroftii TaxID=1343680 RepID=UPI0038315B73